MPGSIRLFVDAPLHPEAEVAATPGQAHYLGAVMRRGVGDAVVLFNGVDGEWQARIAAIRRDRASFVAERRTRAQAGEPDIALAFALLKRDATDLVVQKATELGASAILPVLTERTNAGRVNADRLRAIAVEAAEQCERLTVPRIAEPVRLPEMLAAWPAGTPLFAAVERLRAGGRLEFDGRPAGLLIGPEGGFTPLELDVLRASPFVVMASLGPRVLRAETAAIVGLALMQDRIGG